MSEQVEFPGSEINSSPTTSDDWVHTQSSKADTIRAGVEAVTCQDKAHAWVEQVKIIKALGLLRADAMVEAGTNQPKGKKYCAAMGRLIRLYRFDQIEESDRAKYLLCHTHLAQIEMWRDGLSREQRAGLNYAPNVWRRWNQAMAEQSDDEDDEDEEPAEPTNTAVTVEQLLALFVRADAEEQRKFLASEAVIKDAEVFLAILNRRPEIRRDLERRNINQTVSLLKQKVPDKRVKRLSRRDGDVLYPTAYHRPNDSESPTQH
jgi:hypothetical protein